MINSLGRILRGERGFNIFTPFIKKVKKFGGLVEKM